MNDVQWTIDAPGQWMLDRSHASGGTTPILQHLMSTAMPAGMRRVFRDNGAPVETLQVTFVNDFFYSRLRPLISPDKPPKKLPPEFVLKIATRLHPEMRRRAKAAQRSLETQPWKKVIHDWHNGGRASIEQKNLELQDVDLRRLEDAAVVAHVRRCLDHCLTNWEHHFWLHGFDLGPLGMYLYDAKEWGLESAELLPLLEGASPSTSAPSKSLRLIRDEVDVSGQHPTTLDELRSISPSISKAVDEYLRYRGTVLFSRYDVDGVTLGERPDLVLASILGAESRDVSGDVAERTAAVRSRVPQEHRARFDELLGGARSAMDLRDDNGPTTAEWPLGLLRMGLLELGRRMVAAGTAGAPEDALELRPDELRDSVLDAEAGPSAAELASRRQARRERALLSPPASIGTPEVTPPPHVLPPVLARTVGMVQTVMAELGMDGREGRSGLHGAGIGTASVRGRACVASTSEQALDNLEPGDILVVPYTTPAYNLVLSLASGVVTSEGGPMSHAAVLARELGIAAVIGAKGAVTSIPHGAQIEVDPVAGEVRVLTHV
jgi:pyruvate,water dikinase